MYTAKKYTYITNYDSKPEVDSDSGFVTCVLGSPSKRSERGDRETAKHLGGHK